MCVRNPMGQTLGFRPTLCPGTSSFQDFSMVRPLSPPFPISQCCRSSGGRRGIPNMLNVCSLLSSSRALVTSWQNRERDQSWPQPGRPAPLAQGGLRACGCACVHECMRAPSVSEDTEAWGQGLTPAGIIGERALLEHGQTGTSVCRKVPGQRGLTDMNFLSRKVPSRGLLR